MKILRFIIFICVSLIAVAPNSHAAAPQPEPYSTYLTKVQDRAVNIFNEMVAESNPQQAAKLKGLRIVFTAAPPGEPNGWCSSPWSPALRSEYRGKPLIVVCPYALSVFADYFTAGGITIGSKIKHRDASAISEMREMEQFIAEANEKLARFYLIKAATNYTQTMNGEANTRCSPSAIAYALVHSLPIGACKTSEDTKISKWLNSFGMDENEVDDLWQTAFHEILSALIVHEIGHVVQDSEQKGGKLTPVEDEIAADQFAIKFFNSSPQYIARQISLLNLQILWSHIAILSLDTKYPMPAHETARLQATVKMSSCEKYRNKKNGYNSPEIAKLAKELTKFFRNNSSVSCDK